MASLKKIQEMAADLHEKGLETRPEWIKGVTITDGNQHPMHFQAQGRDISGQVRELADFVVVKESGWDTEAFRRQMSIFLSEVAEQLDDAHQEWLENKYYVWTGTHYGGNK